MARKIFLAMILAGSMVLVGAGVNYANPPEEPPAGFMDEDPEATEAPPLFEKLNLTPQQIELLKQDRRGKRKQMIKTRAEMASLRIDLQEEADKDKPDMARIEVLAKQISELQATMLVEHAKGLIYLRSILTPEQRKSFNAEMIDMKDWHGRHNRWQKQTPPDQDKK